MLNAETIAAIATAPGRGGIGVVRVSGKDLKRVMQSVLGKVLPPRKPVLCNFLSESLDAIDQGIALYFPAPGSYTGEDVLELQGHGGQIVLQMLLQRCLQLGVRLAEPGEFTRRAFFNGKLDLAQAESVADLIDASTRNAAKSAMRSLQGRFSADVHSLVGKLIDLRMLAEATLDFPEEDIDFLQQGDAAARLRDISEALRHLSQKARQGMLLRDGANVVLVGQPNVGKSSLLNRLAEEEVAIVTEIPGTTRDPIRQFLEIEGIPLHIIDTAGLRDTEEVVEKIGIARTRSEMAKADLILYLSSPGVEACDQDILAALEGTPVIRVFNKVDLLDSAAALEKSAGGLAVKVSAKTGEGVDLLKSAILQSLGWQETGEGLFLARERHLAALDDAAVLLQHAKSVLLQPDLLAEDLRLAQLCLSKITGEYGVEDLLGDIFSRFCIGK